MIKLFGDGLEFPFAPALNGVKDFLIDILLCGCHGVYPWLQ
jgi:hypothetical protein